MFIIIIPRNKQALAYKLFNSRQKICEVWENVSESESSVYAFLLSKPLYNINSTLTKASEGHWVPNRFPFRLINTSQNMGKHSHILFSAIAIMNRFSFGSRNNIGLLWCMRNTRIILYIISKKALCEEHGAKEVPKNAFYPSVSANIEHRYCPDSIYFIIIIEYYTCISRYHTCFPFHPACLHPHPILIDLCHIFFCFCLAKWTYFLSKDLLRLTFWYPARHYSDIISHKFATYRHFWFIALSLGASQNFPFPKYSLLSGINVCV